MPVDNEIAAKPQNEQCLRWRNSKIWTSSRVELREALFKIAPYLGELYEGAVLLFYECAIPGRARLIAHAVREIANALPEKIAGHSFPKRFDPTNDLDELVRARNRYGFPLDGVLTNSDDTGMDTALTDRSVRVPRRLFNKMSYLIKRHDQSRMTNREKAVALFKACDPQNPNHIELLIPVLEQWLDVVQCFAGPVHDRKRSDDEILQGKLLVQFEIFETGLRALTTDFFGTASEELDEILENANS